MEIHKIFKETMSNHGKKIELLQWAIIAGISGLVYSDYISRIQQKAIPVRCILVPEIRSVKEFLSSDGEFMERLSSEMIDRMRNHDLIKKYIESPELIIFKDEYIEVAKIVLDQYIIPNITRRIPETISLKFQLNNPDQQEIRESTDIRLFGHALREAEFDFIVNQSVLQLILLLPTLKKNINVPEGDNRNIVVKHDEIITIGHENAICPIHLNDAIIDNDFVMPLISFVTSVKITKVDHEDIKYNMESNPFNQIALTTLL